MKLKPKSNFHSNYFLLLSDGQCKLHEVEVECFKNCTSRTCANLNPPQICSELCVAKKCDCKNGYRRLESGECVPEDQCPNYCSAPNEVMSECYSECSPRTCPNVTGPEPRVCTLQCQIGVCDCKNGYWRNKCGVCVPEALCSQDCSCPCNNQEIKCVNSCNSTTCDNLRPHKKSCPNFCSYRCECAKGYARDTDIDYCVPKTDCCPSSPPQITLKGKSP